MSLRNKPFEEPVQIDDMRSHGTSKIEFVFAVEHDIASEGFSGSADDELAIDLN
jgi:hypothetical protein